MTHPLIDRLTQGLGWPRLASAEDVAAFTGRPGAHCVFVPGDPARNLETTDAAVVLPELVASFQHAFDAAVAAPELEAALGAATGVHKTPAFLFFREGRFLGGIPRVRDWADYMARVPEILARIPETAE